MKRPLAWVSGFVAVALACFALLAFALGAPVRAAQEGTPNAGQAGECPTDATPVSSPAATAEATTAAVLDATPTPGQCVTIGMHDIYYDPNVVTIPADTPVTIALKNEGVTEHTFVVTDHRNPGVPNLNILVSAQPNETKTVTIKAPAGTYYFYCDIPGHEAAGMFGYLKVEKDAKISTETATVTPPAGA